MYVYDNIHNSQRSFRDVDLRARLSPSTRYTCITTVSHQKLPFPRIWWRNVADDVDFEYLEAPKIVVDISLPICVGHTLLDGVMNV